MLKTSGMMRSKTSIIALVLGLFTACSWTHHVWVENVSKGPATVTYKLSCLGAPCFFPDSAVVTSGKHVQVNRLDPADSTITFTLPSGAKAEMGHTWNSTYRYFHENSSENWRVDNLEWIRITTASGTKTLSAAEFVAASDTRKTGRTLFRIQP